MSNEMRAYEVHDRRSQDVGVTVLKWIAGVLAAIASTVIAAGIIGGFLFINKVNQTSTIAQDNARAITDLIDVKANKSSVRNRFEDKQRSINANSARLVVLSNRIDRLYARDTVYRGPLRDTRPRLTRMRISNGSAEMLAKYLAWDRGPGA